MVTPLDLYSGPLTKIFSLLQINVDSQNQLCEELWNSSELDFALPTTGNTELHTIDE